MERLIVPVAALALALSACASPVEPIAVPTFTIPPAATPAPTTEAPATTEAPEPTSTPEPTPTEEALACLDVPADVLTRIATGAQDGTGFAPVRASAFQSPNHGEVYLVALEFAATGVDNSVGVWAANGLTEPGLTLSVDGFAKEFTVWPDASTTDAAIDVTSDGVAEAKECLG